MIELLTFRQLYLDVVRARAHNLLDERTWVAAGVVIREVVDGVVLALLEFEIHSHIHLCRARDVFVAEEGTRQCRARAKCDEGGDDRDRHPHRLVHHNVVFTLTRQCSGRGRCMRRTRTYAARACLSDRLHLHSSGGNPTPPPVHNAKFYRSPLRSSS